MEKFRKLIEIVSNVAIIAVAILLGYFLLSRYNAQPAPPPVAAESRLKSGAKLTMADVDFGKSDRNLLFVLSTACHFCTESMPFYERLTKKTSSLQGTRLIAAFPQDVTESTKYLRDHNVNVDQLVKATPGDAQVRGTPTLILLDRNAVVLETWIGKLTPEKENEVLSRMSLDMANLD
jgi:hypothetical protein